MATWKATCYATMPSGALKAAAMRIEADSIEQAKERVEQFAPLRVYRQLPDATFGEWSVELADAEQEN
jgi:hypothetical protein